MNQPKPSVFETVAVLVTVTKLVSASPTRRALRISTRAHDIYIAPTHLVALGAGIRIVNGQHSEEFCACHVGDWVTKDLYAIADGGTATVHVIEGFEEWQPSEHQRP
jgi:hypothetical protein